MTDSTGRPRHAGLRAEDAAHPLPECRHNWPRGTSRSDPGTALPRHHPVGTV